MRMEVLTGPEPRRRWFDAEKLRIIAEAEEPGVRYADVARRHDITPPQLYQWGEAKREGRLIDAGDEMGATSASSAIGFFKVSPVTADTALPLAAPTAVASIEIALIGGRLLKAPSSQSAAELKRLIRAVEGA